jgi:hypothetical protein
MKNRRRGDMRTLDDPSVRPAEPPDLRTLDDPPAPPMPPVATAPAPAAGRGWRDRLARWRAILFD